MSWFPTMFIMWMSSCFSSTFVLSKISLRLLRLSSVFLFSFSMLCSLFSLSVIVNDFFGYGSASRIGNSISFEFSYADACILASSYAEVCSNSCAFAPALSFCCFPVFCSGEADVFPCLPFNGNSK